MKELLANILTVTYLSNDIHYRSRGANFYGMHLLADRVKDFGSAADDIKEAYYMGFLMIDPPLDTEIASVAGDEYNTICEYGDCVARRLVSALTRTICLVENAKREEGLPAGVHAILDSVSQHALVSRALVDHTIESNPNTEE